jgi:hypothetical protein
VTGDDDLRARLAALDPVRTGTASGPLSEPSPAEIQERIMQTIDQHTDTQESPGAPRRRTRVLAAAAGLVLLAAAGIAAIVTTTGDGGRAPRTTVPTTIALKVAPSSASSSCLRFDVSILRDMPVALAGTVTDITYETVTLNVDRWYTGGTADRVTVTIPDTQTSIGMDGVQFVNGQRYLLTATNGTLNGCGFSGPFSPELEKAYAQAFGG